MDHRRAEYTYSMAGGIIAVLDIAPGSFHRSANSEIISADRGIDIIIKQFMTSSRHHPPQYAVHTDPL